MSTSFPPHESGKCYDFKSARALYWLYFVVGTVSLGIGATNLPDLVEGKNEPYALNWFIVSLVIGLPPLAIAWVRNRPRVRWVRTSESDGLEWYQRRRLWHRTWKQIVAIKYKSIFQTLEDGSLKLCHQTMIITFDDGVQVRLKSWECAFFWYLPFRDYVDRKHALEGSLVKGVYKSPQQAAKAKGAPAVFGLLTIHNHGVEWDGIFHPWDQIEECALLDDFLIIKTTSGDEFLKRTTALGDWHAAIAKLDAAASKMALRPAAPAAEAAEVVKAPTVSSPAP